MSATPPAILAALAAAEARYDGGGQDFSVTTLIDSPRIAQLRRRHAGAVTEATSVGDRIYALWGRAIHQVLEDACAAEPSSVLVEQRLMIEIEHGGRTWKIGGQPDNLRLIRDGGYILDDWKGVGVRSVSDGCKPEWEAQLNLYALLAEVLVLPAGERLAGLRLTALFRDWMRSKAPQRDYPPEPYAVFDVPLWPYAARLAFLRERLALHAAAAELSDEELPECSEAERWARPEKWAVLPRGNKRAYRLLDELDAAHEMAAEMSEKQGRRYEVQHRPGESIRCSQGWCPAARAGVCSQWAREQAANPPAQPAQEEETCTRAS